MRESNNIPTDLVNEKTEPAKQATPQKKRKRMVTLGVVLIMVIAAGAGFWVWHEQPSFCNAICHTPMDSYNASYDQAAGEPGIDKWGNELSNTSSMMAVLHKEYDEDCLSCHVPSMTEQISEGINWVSGNYVYPLEERSLKELTSARETIADNFCLNESCHNMTRDELTASTSGQYRNPHLAQHGELSCGDCHKGHTASINICSQCHDDASIPDGWLSYGYEGFEG